MTKFYYIFQYYDIDKKPDLILVNIPDKSFDYAYRRMHQKYVDNEHLIYKKYDGYNLNCVVFNVHHNHYVFIIVEVYDDEVHDYREMQSVNLQSLAYRMIWDTSLFEGEVEKFEIL